MTRILTALIALATINALAADTERKTLTERSPSSALDDLWTSRSHRDRFGNGHGSICSRCLTTIPPRLRRRRRANFSTR